jgi:hypothetical protein
MENAYTFPPQVWISLGSAASLVVIMFVYWIMTGDNPVQMLFGFEEKRPEFKEDPKPLIRGVQDSNRSGAGR